jgi:putative transposase
MRYARLKPERTESFMHVYNRVVGCAGEFPFGPAEKEEFIRRLTGLTKLYVVDVLGFQCMGNHFHVLLHIPADPPSAEETAARYQRYYGGKRKLNPASKQCAQWALKLRDVSEFMKDLQQPFTRWFNRTRPVRRRGHLWADRFKNTILENGLAVWDCWKYVEMNPVRAGLAGSPADYRFGSFGHWSATGKHPFAEAVTRHLLPALKGLLQVESLAEVQTELRKEFAAVTAMEAKLAPDQIESAIAVAAEKEPFSTRLDRRVRYWVDGLVIGSELFVRDTLASTRGRIKLAKRRLVRARNADRQPEPLYCFRQLRVLLQ